jgi:hypothetical protein
MEVSVRKRDGAEKKAEEVLRRFWPEHYQDVAMQDGVAEAIREAIRDDRARIMDALEGLKPIDKDTILAAVTGALDHAIRLIRMQPFPWDCVRPPDPPVEGGPFCNICGEPLNLGCCNPRNGLTELRSLADRGQGVCPND